MRVSLFPAPQLVNMVREKPPRDPNAALPTVLAAEMETPRRVVQLTGLAAGTRNEDDYAKGSDDENAQDPADEEHVDPFDEYEGGDPEGAYDEDVCVRTPRNPRHRALRSTRRMCIGWRTSIRRL